MLICSEKIDLTEIETACNLPHWTDRQLIFVSFDNNKPVAFLSADYVLDECTIFDIGCLPRYRRQGLAKGLINELIIESKMRNFAFITLEVRSKNAPAIKLYEKCGFELAGTRNNYYSAPNDDALIYTLFLR